MVSQFARAVQPKFRQASRKSGKCFALNAPGSSVENPTMTEAVPSTARSADSYWLTRLVLLRLLGGVYAVAFLAAGKQIVPLIGSHGLLPADLFLESRGELVETRRSGPLAAAFVRQRPAPAEFVATGRLAGGH
jgi:hypothetical protein